MNGNDPIGERLAALFALGLVLFSPLFLSIFDVGPEVTWMGIPLLYVAIFAAWAALIALMALAVERGGEPMDLPRIGPPPADEP